MQLRFRGDFHAAIGEAREWRRLGGGEEASPRGSGERVASGN